MYGLTRGTRLVARCREVVAVAGLLWIYIYIFILYFLVFGGILFLFCFLYIERTRPTASMRPSCLIYLSTSTGVRTGYHYLISLCICQSVCSIRRFY